MHLLFSYTGTFERPVRPARIKSARMVPEDRVDGPLSGSKTHPENLISETRLFPRRANTTLVCQKIFHINFTYHLAAALEDLQKISITENTKIGGFRKTRNFITRFCGVFGFIEQIS